MKAIVRDKYGSPDVLELREIAKPAVEDDHVLVRVHAASINAGDWHAMRGKPYIIRLMLGGLFKPRTKNAVLGGDLAGRGGGGWGGADRISNPERRLRAGPMGLSWGLFPLRRWSWPGRAPTQL